MGAGDEASERRSIIEHQATDSVVLNQKFW